MAVLEGRREIELGGCLLDRLDDRRAAMARARTERAYRALLKRYDVVIERPE